MRERILDEIKRLAAVNEKPPGKLTFARETGIKEHHWSGVIWARWGDALIEAGFKTNSMQGRFQTKDVLVKVLEACRAYGRIPSSAELRLYRRSQPSFPSHNTISHHFSKRAGLLRALADYCNQAPEYGDVAAMLPKLPQLNDNPRSDPKKQTEGFVYLLKSGNYYKIGRSDNVERRVKEIRISLPETISIVHSIRTDDPPGIEAYWHKRFAGLRANGEWFKLGPAEVASFKRHKCQ